MFGGFLGGSYNPFPNFTFSGPLRPAYPLSAKRQVPGHIARPEYAEDGQPLPVLSTLAGEKLIMCQVSLGAK